MLFSFQGLAAMALAAAGTVEAHYRFSKLVHNGRLTNDWEYMRENSNGIMPTKQFLTPSDDFRCNSGSFANAQKTKVMKVAPGDQIGFQLWYYATMKHPGPLTIHMSRAPGDVRQYRGDGDWFKVHQMIICRPPINGYLVCFPLSLFPSFCLFFSLPPPATSSSHQPLRKGPFLTMRG